MQDINIREVLYNNLDELKRLMITDRQRNIMLFLGDGGKLSADVAQEFDISIYSASNTLTRLYKAGWIKRVNVLDPTGGDMYKYHPIYPVAAYDEGGDHG